MIVITIKTIIMKIIIMKNDNSDEKQPNTPKDDVESSTDSNENKNPHDIPKDGNKENNSDKEKGFYNKNSITENDDNYDLSSKSVFGTNEHSFPYRESISNKIKIQIKISQI